METTIPVEYSAAQELAEITGDAEAMKG